MSRSTGQPLSGAPHGEERAGAGRQEESGRRVADWMESQAQQTRAEAHTGTDPHTPACHQGKCAVDSEVTGEQLPVLPPESKQGLSADATDAGTAVSVPVGRPGCRVGVQPAPPHPPPQN